MIEKRMIPLFLLAWALSVGGSQAQQKEVRRTTECEHVADQWVRHDIARGVWRDHGLTVNVGDLDDDGRMDALVCHGSRRVNTKRDGLYWYQCPENPQATRQVWSEYRITPIGVHPRWAWGSVTGDVDNDGDIDVIIDSFNEAKVYLCLNPINQGGDIYLPWRTFVLHDSGTRFGQRIVLNDIDKDGYRDIAFLKWNPNAACILFNPGLTPSDPDQPWIYKKLAGCGGSDTYSIRCFDIDNDGDLDLISAAGDGNTKGAVYWYEHPNGKPRDGQWIRRKVSRFELCFGGLQVDDVDGDGLKDILACDGHATSVKNSVWWFKNPGLPSLQAPKSPWKEFVIGDQIYASASCLIDVDGDGANEIWVPDASNGTSGDKWMWATGGIVYFKTGPNPTEPWTRHIVRQPPERGRQTRACDVDSDGDLDLVSSADHECNYYSAEGTHLINLVWWENRTPQKKFAAVKCNEKQSTVDSERHRMEHN
jgi:hypothetical protein